MGLSLPAMTNLKILVRKDIQKKENIFQIDKYHVQRGLLLERYDSSNAAMTSGRLQFDSRGLFCMLMCVSGVAQCGDSWRPS